MKLKEKSHTFYIDVYDAWFEVVVSNDLPKSRNHKKRRKRLGEYHTQVPYAALSSIRGSHLAVFFHRDKVTHSDIAHEVFHSTLNIIGLIGDKIDLDNHETSAYLNGYLTRVIYKKLKSWGIEPK